MAILNPIMQISVAPIEILVFINPVNQFTTAQIMKQKHIPNVILEATV